MPSIPKNNLRERMLKLHYNPDLIKIVPPILDNSKVVKKEQAPAPANRPYEPVKNQENFKPPEFINLDDWSDFEEDE